MKAIAVHFVHEWKAQSGGLIRDQFPLNTTPARREASAVTVENTITEWWAIYS